jgi:hypothetical protein
VVSEDRAQPPYQTQKFDASRRAAGFFSSHPHPIAAECHQQSFPIATTFVTDHTCPPKPKYFGVLRETQLSLLHETIR